MLHPSPPRGSKRLRGWAFFCPFRQCYKFNEGRWKGIALITFSELFLPGMDDFEPSSPIRRGLAIAKEIWKVVPDFWSWTPFSLLLEFEHRRENHNKVWITQATPRSLIVIFSTVTENLPVPLSATVSKTSFCLKARNVFQNTLSGVHPWEK